MPLCHSKVQGSSVSSETFLSFRSLQSDHMMYQNALVKVRGIPVAWLQERWSCVCVAHLTALLGGPGSLCRAQIIYRCGQFRMSSMASDSWGDPRPDGKR